VATYLTLAHLDVLSLVCTRGAGHGCEEVATHPTARGFGIPALHAIPTAAFGILMYAAIVGLGFVRVASMRRNVVRDAGRAQWLISFAGVLVAAWLTYLEAYVIHAWCQWCVASAIITLLIFLTSTVEMLGSRAVPATATSGGTRLEEA